MNIGIIGARVRDSEDDYVKLKTFLIPYLEELYKIHSDITFVSGGAKKGGDRFAELLSKELNIPIIIHYPDLSKLPKNYNRRDYAIIAYERNTLIARDSDILIALVKPERKGGTEDTIRKFSKIKGQKAILL